MAGGRAGEGDFLYLLFLSFLLELLSVLSINRFLWSRRWGTYQTMV